jgi:hypothetical protein
VQLAGSEGSNLLSYRLDIPPLGRNETDTVGKVDGEGHGGVPRFLRARGRGMGAVVWRGRGGSQLAERHPARGGPQLAERHPAGGRKRFIPPADDRRAVLFVTAHTPTHTNARQREGPASTCLPSAPRTPRTPQRSVSPSPRAAQGQLPRGGSFGSRSSHAPSWSSSSSRSTHGRASMSPRRSPGNLLLHADRASRCASPCLAPQHPR